MFSLANVNKNPEAQTIVFGGANNIFPIGNGSVFFFSPKDLVSFTNPHVYGTRVNRVSGNALLSPSATFIPAGQCRTAHLVAQRVRCAPRCVPCFRMLVAAERQSGAIYGL